MQSLELLADIAFIQLSMHKVMRSCSNLVRNQSQAARRAETHRTGCIRHEHALSAQRNDTGVTVLFFTTP